MKIFCEDKNLIVCLKPRNVISQLGNGENMIALLNSHFKENGEKAEAFPVHRLDKETAGIMVYAKNSASAAALSKAIAGNNFRKHYYAVIKGSPDEKSGIMKDLLFHDKTKNKVFTVDKVRTGVKDASLEYKILEESDGFCLADILLHTGRTHQIRAQFSSRNLPLYGDRKYGGPAGELALFAHKLEFPDPQTGELLSFSALPDTEEAPWCLFKKELK